MNKRNTCAVKFGVFVKVARCVSWFALLCIQVLFLFQTEAQVARGEALSGIAWRDTQGRTWTPQNLRGKVVVIDFWASWCDPCVHELKLLQELKRIHGEHLVVLAVGQDETLAGANRFWREQRLSLPMVWDSGHAIAKQFKPTRMPSSWIVDHQGKVRFIHSGFTQSDERAIRTEVADLVRAKRQQR